MEIDCEFHERHYCAGDVVATLFYTCSVASTSISKRFTEVKAFKGEHLPGKSNNDVKLLTFHCTRVDYLPRGFQKIFNNLTHLRILNCGLKEISREDLIGLENLEMLNLKCNELRSVPNNLLENMHKLTMVTFCDNKIECLSSQLFTPLKNQLHFIGLRGNGKIDATFHNTGYRNSIPFTELMEMIDSNYRQPVDEQHEFIQTMEELWKSKHHSDLEIIVDSKKYQVHKAVLATRSSVFSSMFENNGNERQSNQVTISGSSADVVESFLEFFYTGRISDSTIAMELSVLASKYDDPQLKQICDELLLENLDESDSPKDFSLEAQYLSEKTMSPQVVFSSNLKNSSITAKEVICQKNQHDDKLKELQDTCNAEKEKLQDEYRRKFQKLLKEHNAEIPN